MSAQQSVVVATESGTVFGPFGRTEARRFAEFVTAEVDPAEVRLLCSPATELLNWREHCIPAAAEKDQAMPHTVIDPDCEPAGAGQPAPAKPERTTADAETVAMSMAYGAFRDLDQMAQHRVVRWLTERLADDRRATVDPYDQEPPF